MKCSTPASSSSTKVSSKSFSSSSSFGLWDSNVSRNLWKLGSLHWQMGSANWGRRSTGLANEESVGGDAGRSVWGGPSVIEVG